MSAAIWALLANSLGETLYMIGVSGLLAASLGIPLGVMLHVTARGGLIQSLWLNRVAGFIVNAARSTPFIILMVAVIPLTRFLVGRSIGTSAAIVPLALAALPFMGRIVEGALKEVSPGVVEAAQAMGASPLAIITRVLLPESMPSIISGLTLMVISLVGYSAMAGAIGGGGLGDLAIRYGYQRFRGDVMLATVVVLVAQVQIIQSCGDLIAAKLNKK